MKEDNAIATGEVTSNVQKGKFLKTQVTPVEPYDPEALIEVQHLTKCFGTLKVLDNISHKIYKGERIAIIGPSGSGKSTFLRCLNVLEDPTDGYVFFGGKNLCDFKVDINEQRRRMGMVFQHFNLFNNLTILGNIILAPVTAAKIERKRAKKLNALKAKYAAASDEQKAILASKAAKLSGEPVDLTAPPAPIRTNAEIKQAATDKAMALLTRIGLADKANVYPSTLSGGQKQRVAIIRALAMDHEALLFDEPTSALDIEMVKEVLSLIQTLADEGMTMVIVTHELKFARSFASRVLFMDGGTILESGTPDDIFGNPQAERLKTFLNQVSD